MTTAARASHQIDRKGRTIRKAIGRSKYSIDYRQREYFPHERAYDHRLVFQWFMQASEQPSCRRGRLHKAKLDTRRVLYHTIAAQICNPNRLDEEAVS